MNKNLVGAEVRDELYAAEASLEVALADSQRLLQRMLTAREQLGLTGSLGDAAIARVTDCVHALEQAKAAQDAGHEELTALMGALDLRVRTKAKAPFKSLGFKAA